MAPIIDESKLPTVDIFIPIYNEPKEILYRTIIGCKAQKYPEKKMKIYILDDGRRQEIKDVAVKLGCEYITRPTNEYAKAGNLNNALKYSGGEIIAIFDCDHIPVRSFLKETVRFFSDPKVAFVQTPHHFYNPDIYQKNLRFEKEIANEQDLFFHVVQPGKGFYNSAFFAGSCGLLRRSCLKHIGGFKTATLTEDLHTSMELHSRGYKSVFLNKDLTAGLFPESYVSYLKQRKRWTKGSTQIFILDNPLLKRGLTFHQRLNYLASIIYFFHGLPRIIYLSAPLAYLLLRRPPLITDISVLLCLYLPHYIASTKAFNMISKGYRNPFWSDVYETAMCFGITGTICSVFLMPKQQTFVVTPKGERFRKPTIKTSFVLPHAILLALLLIGSAIGYYKYLSYTEAQDLNAISVSLVWAIYNSLILVAAITTAREMSQRRGLIRLSRSIRCTILPPEKELTCITRDISETGLSIILNKPIKLTNQTVKLSLISNYGETTNLKGKVVRFDKGDGRRLVAGIHFIDLNEEDYHSIIRLMFSSEDSWHNKHDIATDIWKSFVLLSTSSIRMFVRDNVVRRASPRFDVKWPCDVILSRGIVRGTTIDASSSGLSMKLHTDGLLPREVYLKIYPKRYQGIQIKGRVQWRKERKDSIEAGIRFINLKEGLWKEVRYL